MTISSSGYSGTVTEAGWAGLAGAIAPYAEAGGWLVSAVTANGLAQVTVAAGYVTGCGVRAFTDGTTAGGSLLTLTPPATGGAWFLIVARRTWSPTATTTLVAVAGPTTGSTAVPSAPPATFPVLNNTPGTLHDQPLAWAFVAAGSTTVTLWDARLLRTGVGQVQAPSLQVLQAHYTLGTFALGALVGVGALVTAGGTLRPSLWRLGQPGATATFTPEGTLRASAPGALTDLGALLDGGALPNVGLPGTALGYSESNATTYRHVGAGNTALGANAPTSAWQAWSRSAVAFTPTWQNLTIGSSAVLAEYGITEGVTWAAVNVTGGTGFAVNATLDVSFTLPSAVVTGLGTGTGLYAKTGSTVDLVTFPVGTNGQASTSCRIRGKWAAAAPGAVTQVVLGQAIVASATTDGFQATLAAPSAAVA